MDRIKYTDWQKLPSGGMWRRDPSSMRCIGLKVTNTTDRLSLTPKMTLRTGETVEGPLGTGTTTSVLFGMVKSISGSLRTTKTTQERLEPAEDCW